MSTSTKESLAAALKQMMNVKPIGKITVKDLVEICGVNRQTFYYHFDDVYDLLEWVFEEDANRVLPHKVVYEHWREDEVHQRIGHEDDTESDDRQGHAEGRQIQPDAIFQLLGLQTEEQS